MVTIGLPLFNGEKDMRRAIDSLLNQTYSDFQLIISDNASTDNTWAICQEYAQKDSRVKIIRQDTNIGAVPNFCFCANEAKTPYFMWSAEDDIWEPQFIERLIKVLEEHPNVGVAMGAFSRVREDGSVYDTVRFNGWQNPTDKPALLRVLLMGTPLKYNLFQYGLFRTDIVQKALKVCYNVLAWDRVFMFQVAAGCSFYYVDDILYKKTVHQKTFVERLPEEKFSKMTKKAPWPPAVMAKYIYKTLTLSHITPGYIKLLSPVIVIMFLLNATLFLVLAIFLKSARRLRNEVKGKFA